MNVSFTEQVQRDMPQWANDPLLAWDATAFAAMSDFITEHYWTGQGSINVFRIVGTDHPQYAGMTWLELMERG
ncbi:TPA: hypothetical protein ACUKOM_004843, partial [Escherichia coli]